MNRLNFKIAIRYLLKNKLYSLINITGLAIGVASFVLIMLYVNYERSYDSFKGSENVYRVYMEYLEGDTFVPGDAQTYNLSGPTLQKEFPEIREQLRVYRLEQVTFVQGEKVLEEPNGSLSDASYFNIFPYPLLEGNRETALKDPNSIVLTESLAVKLFGDEDPLGKTLTVFYGTKTLVTVTGILEDVPQNTHIRTNFLISYDSFKTWEGLKDQTEPNWNMNNFFTYIKVDKGADIGLLRKKILESDFEDDKDERHNIEALRDIHLYSDKPYEAEANGSVGRIRFLWAIALIILILSWLNYVNLSTTKSLERAKEIGVRKVAGAQRPQLVLQSLVESMILNGIAIGIAGILIGILLPLFNGFTGKELVLDGTTLVALLPMLGFLVLGMLVSALYPAILLGNFSPARALKGKVRTSAHGLQLRKGLILFQFFATIILLVGTFVVSKQISFLGQQPIGANLDQVVALSGTLMGETSDSIIRQQFRTLETELKKLPFVRSVAKTMTYPGDGYDNLGSTVGITYPNGTNNERDIYYTYETQPEYFKTLDIRFLAGNTFLQTAQGQSNQVIINEKFAHKMGITDLHGALNETVKFWGRDWIIVGVIEDYHHFGLKNRIEPLLIRHTHSSNNLLVKMDDKAISISGMGNAIGQMEAKWKSVFPKSTFKYNFIDQKFDAQYKEDKMFGTAFRLFTLLAIGIASMGLFGLTSYTVIQRKKEIGIRKVNGATIGGILTLLNRDFMIWVGLAFLVAVPVSWFAMRQWLEGFAYRTTMDWWLFVLAGGTALGIALLTVSWQSFKAATNNPVDALRDE